MKTTSLFRLIVTLTVIFSAGVLAGLHGLYGLPSLLL